MAEKDEGKPVEIERKFVVTADVREKILHAGGTFSGEVVLSDSYFDNDSYNLTMKDFWLRRRNDNWELKMPPKVRDGKSVCSQYQEVTCEHDIVRELWTILTNKMDMSPTSQSGDVDVVNGNDPVPGTVQVLLEKFRLQPFATFTTHRKNYSFQDNLLVTLDEADFGFQVGEIEKMVQDNNAEEVSAAVSKIDALAKDLGFSALVSVQGKLEAFLSAQNPSMYQALVDAKILKDYR